MNTISTRLDEHVLKDIESLAKEMKLDRSALVRKFILDGYNEAMIHKNLLLVRDGVLSIEQAAEATGQPVSRILRAARHAGIEIGADASTLDHELAVITRHVEDRRRCGKR